MLRALINIWKNAIYDTRNVILCSNGYYNIPHTLQVEIAIQLLKLLLLLRLYGWVPN